MRRCPNGHCFDDQELIFCPECGLPMKDYDARTEEQTESIQQEGLNNQTPASSAAEESKAPSKALACWIFGILFAFVAFVILEITDTTFFVPSWHQRSEQSINTQKSVEQDSAESESPVTVETSLVPAFNIPKDQLIEMAKSILAQEPYWTKETAPQNISDFPLLPEKLRSLPHASIKYGDSEYYLEFIQSFDIPYAYGTLWYDIGTDSSCIYLYKDQLGQSSNVWYSESTDSKNVYDAWFNTWYNIDTDSFVDDKSAESANQMWFSEVVRWYNDVESPSKRISIILANERSISYEISDVGDEYGNIVDTIISISIFDERETRETDQTLTLWYSYKDGQLTDVWQ